MPSCLFSSYRGLHPHFFHWRLPPLDPECIWTRGREPSSAIIVPPAAAGGAGHWGITQGSAPSQSFRPVPGSVTNTQESRHGSAGAHHSPQSCPKVLQRQHGHGEGTRSETEDQKVPFVCGPGASMDLSTGRSGGFHPRWEQPRHREAESPPAHLPRRASKQTPGVSLVKHPAPSTAC